MPGSPWLVFRDGYISYEYATAPGAVNKLNLLPICFVRICVVHVRVRILLSMVVLDCILVLGFQFGYSDLLLPDLLFAVLNITYNIPGDSTNDRSRDNPKNAIFHEVPNFTHDYFPF